MQIPLYTRIGLSIRTILGDMDSGRTPSHSVLIMDSNTLPPAGQTILYMMKTALQRLRPQSKIPSPLLAKTVLLLDNYTLIEDPWELRMSPFIDGNMKKPWEHLNVKFEALKPFGIAIIADPTKQKPHLKDIPGVLIIKS